jgi:alpha-L-rhamnosidase
MDTITSEIRWDGRWIWTDTDGTEKNAYLLFRRAFGLRDVPDRAVLRITACSRYRLYINGVLAGEGPPKSQPFLTYYDEYVLAGERAGDADGPRLLRGDNIIAVIVQHVGYDDDSRGGLLAELRPLLPAAADRDAGGPRDTPGSALITTDGLWKVTRSPAWRANTYFCFFHRVAPYQEHFDARKIDPRWLEARFDDSGWADATIVRGRQSDRPPRVSPWTRIVPRDIPFMSERRLYATEVTETGEITAATNRTRSEDLSISLSQPAIPVELATVDSPEALLAPEGETALACSTAHRSDTKVGIREPVVMLDFGRIVNAYVELDLEGPAGARVEIGYAERLLDGHFNNAIEGQFADAITIREGRVRWRIFAWKAFRYLRIRVHDAFAPLVVYELAAGETSYPFDERGSFSASDEELERIFEMCRYTVRIGCNEYITDTPWREQGQWLGDVAAVTLGAIYACFGETRLARKFLRQSAATQYPTGFLGNMTNTFSANWQGVLVDFSLWWLMALRDYYRYSGEEEIVHELYPVAVRLIDAVLAYRNPEGIVEDMPYVVFIDWAHVDRSGASAAFNAIFAGALDAMRELAEFRGDEYTVRRASEAREAIVSRFSGLFWDEDEGLFCDTVDGGVSSGRFSEQTNSAAIVFGLASESQAGTIVERLWARGDNFLGGTNNGVTEANPFFTSVVLKALSTVGRGDLALGVIRDRWGRRMLDAGSSSTHEEWSIHGSWRNGDELTPIMRTLSHAWSAFPARWLVEYLAGITILRPGCRKVSVEPISTPFDYYVVFPTPEGDIRVSCRDGAMEVHKPDSISRAE